MRYLSYDGRVFNTLQECQKHETCQKQQVEKAEREKVFKDYQINDKVMEVAKDDAMVLHCLPAHREEEITAKVFEEHANEIFDEAENRLHAQKAVLVKLLG